MDPPPPTTTATTTTTSLPSTNPPSVEAAYKRKCIALKKRLNEVEAENELMRLRNRRGWQYIQKMRLESCILLERLAKVTGMAEEAAQMQAQGNNNIQGNTQGQLGLAQGQGVLVNNNPELRTRAAEVMSNAAILNSSVASSSSAAAAATAGETGNGNGNGNANTARYLDDETEGSSDEQPPTPQERPLRIKRSKKPNLNPDDDVPPNATNNDTNMTEPTTSGPAGNGTTGIAGNNNGNGNGGRASSTTSSVLPRLAPAPSQEEMTSSFRIQTTNNSHNGSVGGGGSSGGDNNRDRRHSHYSHSSHHESESGIGMGRSAGHVGESSLMGTMDLDFKVKEES